jgi:hypothetical protein
VVRLGSHRERSNDLFFGGMKNQTKPNNPAKTRVFVNRDNRAATLTLAARLAQDGERKSRRSTSPRGGGKREIERRWMRVDLFFGRKITKRSQILQQTSAHFFLTQ